MQKPGRLSYFSTNEIRILGTQFPDNSTLIEPEPLIHSIRKLLMTDEVSHLNDTTVFVQKSFFLNQN